MFEIYKNKKVLITGHTGFKGSWLSIWLNIIGAEVYGYSLDPIENNGILAVGMVGQETFNSHYITELYVNFVDGGSF